MSITKSYNKQTGIYYAYETTYEWSDEKQKKVQHKRCIGQFDPETGEVVPNGKVGRPSMDRQRQKHSKPASQDAASDALASDNNMVKALADRLSILEKKASTLSDEIHNVIEELSAYSNPDD